ncbi:MAG: molybdate ABC transporter substrate-binding protein [Desulfovibrio sp.]|jgi:molybdate transport system substrate-binding protein|nr:molybdate ABC transporter substrate-binding protein [Desulfovibrio sp.]
MPTRSRRLSLFQALSTALLLALSCILPSAPHAVHTAQAAQEARAAQDPVELHMYAGAGLRVPAEAVISRFEQRTGARVVVEYGGMGQLLTRFNATGTGDVILSGGEQYVRELATAGKISSEHKLVLHTPVMAVRKDKAAGIATLADLAASNLRIAMGDPQAIALGKSGEKLLDASGHGEALRGKVTVRGTTIKQVLLYLTNGDVDAAVIGRSDAVANAASLVILPTPQGTPREVGVVAALSTSTHPELAEQLAAFFAEPESIKVFVDHGFLPLPAK